MVSTEAGSCSLPMRGHHGVRSSVTDALLCHDDELEGRRIAFILYLVPPWDASLGGTLDLFSVDGKAEACTSTPADISKFLHAMSVLVRGDGSHLLP